MGLAPSAGFVFWQLMSYWSKRAGADPEYATRGAEIQKGGPGG